MTDFIIYACGTLLGALGAGALLYLVVWYRFRRHGRLWGFKR